MIELTDEEWDGLFDKAEETIQQVISELPEPVKNKAESIDCKLDRYCPKENWKVLGMYFSWTSGPIFVYVGQIYEDSRKNMEEAMKSVRQVYLHELAHAVGNLEEYEVKERGL